MTDQLGKYMLVAEVARGGMGIVYLASSIGPAGFSKLLVIKELRPDLADDPVFLQMFLEEARLAARLNHPNIVQTYEVGVDGNRQYIVMDYLDGVPLSRILRKKSPLFTVEMHLRVICEALQGLQYAHTLCEFDGTPLGLVHRDVSPQNVFVTFDGQTKVVDFGIAKARDSAIETSTGVMKGKPAYMPAEQITGDVDSRADVYAAGVMIWEAVAGRRLWHRMGDLEILSGVLTGVTPDLASVAPNAPPELVAIVQKALSQERENRQASAAELQHEVEHYLSTMTKNPTMRDVAAAVGELFVEERNTTRTTLETHLNDLKMGRRAKLPSMPPMHDSLGQSVPSYPGPSGPLVAPIGATTLPSISGHPSSSSAMSTAITTGTLVSNGENARRPAAPRKKRTAAIAVLVVLLSLGGFAFGLRGRGSSAADPASDDSDPKAQAGTSAAGLPVAIPPPEPPLGPSAEPTAATTNPAPTSSTREPSAPTTTRVTVAPRPPPFRAPPPPPPRRPPGPAPSAADEHRAAGFLTIDTYPWTHVTVGGKALGSTPLVRVSLPAGTHTLVLDNPTENIHRTTVVVIKSGETVSRRLAF